MSAILFLFLSLLLIHWFNEGKKEFLELRMLEKFFLSKFKSDCISVNLIKRAILARISQNNSLDESLKKLFLQYFSQKKKFLEWMSFSEWS